MSDAPNHDDAERRNHMRSSHGITGPSRLLAHTTRTVTTVLLGIVLAGCGADDQPITLGPSPSGHESPNTSPSTTSTSQPAKVVQFRQRNGHQPWGRIHIPAAWDSSQSGGSTFIKPPLDEDVYRPPFGGTATRWTYDFDSFKVSRNAALTDYEDNGFQVTEQADLLTEGGELYHFTASRRDEPDAYWDIYGTVIDNQTFEISWRLDTTMISPAEANDMVLPVMKTFIPLSK